MATAELPPGNRKLVTRAPAAPPEKQPEKKVERIATGGVVRRKQPWYKNVKESLFPGNEESIGSYVAHEIVIPMVRNTIEDAIIGATQRALGSAGLPASRGIGGRRTNYSNNRYDTSPGLRTGNREISARGRATHNFDDIVLDKRVEAEGVLSALIAQIDDYGVATVAEMYEMVGVSSQFTDRNWGWDDLRGADVVRDRDGYRLNLPRPEPIK